MTALEKMRKEYRDYIEEIVNEYLTVIKKHRPELTEKQQKKMAHKMAQDNIELIADAEMNKIWSEIEAA